MEGFSSTAAQVIIAVIPIVGIVIGGIIVFFYLLWRHKQVSLMIKAGNYAPRFNLRLFSLLAGYLLLGVGLVLSVLFILIEGLTYSLLGGLIPLALGIGLLVFFRIAFPSGTLGDINSD